MKKSARARSKKDSMRRPLYLFGAANTRAISSAGHVTISIQTRNVTSYLDGASASFDEPLRVLHNVRH